MPSIQLKALTAATPDGRALFSNLDLSFGPHRTGLVGRNGTGKTTLLRIIAGEIAPRAGRVVIDGTIGVLRQSVSAGGDSIAQALGVVAGLGRLARIDAGSATPDDVEAADWSLDARIAQSLAAVGLSALDLDRPVATLSGGQRTRLSLAALLLDAPDVLLLDEPTNNLDADGRAAVGELLRTWRGGAIVVSHDRDLLRGMDEIVELTSLGVKSYGGNWDVYEARRAIDLAAAEHDLAMPSGGWARSSGRRSSAPSARPAPTAAAPGRRPRAASLASSSAATRAMPRKAVGRRCGWRTGSAPTPRQILPRRARSSKSSSRCR